MKKASGILMPVFSLPSEYGIGCFSKEAYFFVDWLKSAGQSYWQILPLGPTGYGDSPYQSFSVFAGNPYFIDLEELISEGLLDREDCDNSYGDKIDYGRLYAERYKVLKKAYSRSKHKSQESYRHFIEENEFWLGDYALFMACKDHFGGKEFTLWEKEIACHEKDAVQRYEKMLSDQVDFYKFLQYRFYSDWGRLKEYANKNGIRIIGDIPIYTALDSSDVWADRELFKVDKNGVPYGVAGCPPDGFSKDGQLWGNPVYDWKYHEKTIFSWWIKRLEHCFSMYDVVRIDHFRGFDEYYEIPYGETTARRGKWVKGPGMKLFSAFEKAFGRGEIIAEDLGFITDSVKKLVDDCGFCGMKVLQFAFDSRDGGGSVYLPHNYPYNCAAYTGTHDNSTLKGWLEELPDNEMELLRAYLCDYRTARGELVMPIISLVMRSRARFVVIPIQDWLEQGDSARINTPSTLGGNWVWRAEKSQLSTELANKIKETTQRYGRV